MKWIKRRRTRKRAMGGAAVGVVVATALVAQMSMVSNASWNDSEWVNAGSVGTVDCESPDEAFATRSEGKLLSGSLLGLNLDTLARVSGVSVTNDGEDSTESPVGTPETPPGSDAYSNPLDVSALGLIHLDLSKLLELPLDTRTGVVGQYAKATRIGQAIGASGTVVNDGGISLEQFEGDVPDLATLSLSGLLNSPGIGLGSLLSGVTDLELAIGAVAGRGWLDGCANSWSVPDALSRDYLVSYLNLNLDSPLVGDLATTISGTTGLLENTANSLIGDQNILSGVVGSVVSLLTNVLSSSVVSLLLGLLGFRVKSGGTSTAELTVLDLNLSPVQTLLDGPISDSQGVVSVELSKGLITINTAALLETAYPGSGGAYPNGLNGLAPNTEPLKDQHVLDTLLDRLGGVLEGILEDVSTALVDVIDNAIVGIKISVPTESRKCTLLVLCGPWEDHPITITVSGTLSGLLTNSEEVVVGVDLSAVPVLGGILTPLTNALVNGLKGTVGGLLGTVLDNILRPLTKLPTDLLDTGVKPVTNLVQVLYTDLFLDGVVSLTLNAQNDPFEGGPEPTDWVTTPNSGILDGQYDVAALRVGVLGLLRENDVRLYLGRGSVGPACSEPAVAAGGCPGH